MTITIVWQEGTARVEHRSGLYWCYIGDAHVGTVLGEVAAVKLIRRKQLQTS